ncbi:MAG: tetratricopeptide repeat protein [Planctomycetota bacterium]
MTDSSHNEKVEAKLLERRQKWRFNTKLLGISGGIAAVLIIGSAASYAYNSTRTAATIKLKADEAGANQDYDEQAKWLRQYSLLNPGDLDAVYQSAIAIDRHVDSVARNQKADALNKCRRQLGAAIAEIGDVETRRDQVADLRRRLIKRLNELGGFWGGEARRQIERLNPPAEDAQMIREYGMALAGQIISGYYQPDSSSARKDKSVDHWGWLGQQTVEDQMLLALDNNQGNLDLCGMAVELFAREREVFLGSSVDEDDSLERLDGLIDSIRDLQGGRAAFTIYRYDVLRGRQVEASERLLADAEQAVTRLKESPSDDQPVSSNDEATYWDHQLVSTAASVVVPDQPGRAMSWLEELKSVDSPLTSVDQKADVYFRLAAMYSTAGQPAAAIAVLREGLDEIDPTNLRLLGSLARMLVSQPDWTQDQKDGLAQVMTRYQSAISDASVRLAGLSDQARRQLGRGVDLARWELDAIAGAVAGRQGDLPAAIRRLKSALDSTIDVDASQLALVARQLAEIYERQGSADQAALVLSQAVDQNPNDESLRAAAAQAAFRAGSAEQAISILRLAQGNPAVQLASIEAELSLQMQRLPAERDLSGIRSKLAGLKTAAGSSTAENLAVQIDLLNLRIPPPGVSMQDHVASQGFRDQVNSLADRYPNRVSVRRSMALMLAQLGDRTKSSEIVEQLKSNNQLSPSESQLLDAQLKVVGGQAQSAIKDLQQAATNDDENATVYRQYAYRIARGQRNLPQAYGLLAGIPAQELQPRSLYEAAVLAHSLEEVPKDEVKRWLDSIAEVEGEYGTYADRFRVERLIEQLAASESPVDRKDSRLREAKRLVTKMQGRRPGWGPAYALEAQLLVFEGDVSRAIDRLRRAVRIGDRSPRTRSLLVRLLIRAGRDAEASREIELASYRGQQLIQNQDQVLIGLAGRRGKFDEALRFARQDVAERPEDPVAALTLARTAMIAATASPQAKPELINEANLQIERAFELPGHNPPQCWAAKLALELRHGDTVSQEKVINLIAEADLMKPDRLRLEARAALAQNRLDDAASKLEELDPTEVSAREKYTLATIYRQLGDAEKAIGKLSEAQRTDPENERYRNELAGAVIQGKQVIGDAEWDELEKLLSADAGGGIQNRLSYALLLTRGNKLDQAETVVRELIAEKTANSDDAKRLLLALLRQKLKSSSDVDNSSANDSQNTLPLAGGSDAVAAGERHVDSENIVAECIQLYEDLIDVPKPRPQDVGGYIDFLMTSDPEATTRVERLIKQLKLTPQGWLTLLNLQLSKPDELAEAQEPVGVVSEWVSQSTQSQVIDEFSANTAAGGVLLRLGMATEAVPYLGSAYDAKPEGLSNYVIALNQAKQINQAVKVARKHYEGNGDARSAILLGESLLQEVDLASSKENRLLLDRILRDHSDKPEVLESIATIRFAQNRSREAIELYQQCLKLSPTRVRTLNNLAMALAEIPGRASEGIEPIDTALKLANDNPELLDTKGTVLLGAGRYREAKAVFQKALSLSDEPRFKFHLVVTQLKLDQQYQAKETWASIDLDKLDPSGLTAKEQKVLQQYINDFPAK